MPKVWGFVLWTEPTAIESSALAGSLMERLSHAGTSCPFSSLLVPYPELPQEITTTIPEPTARVTSSQRGLWPQPYHFGSKGEPRLRLAPSILMLRLDRFKF